MVHCGNLLIGPVSVSALLCKKKLLKAKRTTKTFEDPKCDVSKRMASKSAYSISLCLVLFLCSFADGKSVCSEEQLTESQRAFRNCVESAKAGIVSSHANSEDENVVCHSLENMLLTCDAEVSNFLDTLFQRAKDKQNPFLLSWKMY